MFKKIIYFALLLAFSVFLVSCNIDTSTKDKTKAHEHSFVYGCDSRNHYYVCECGEEKDYAPHQFIEKIEGNSLIQSCSVCNYEKKAKQLITLVNGIKYVDNNYYIDSEEGLLNFAAIISGSNDEYLRDTFQNTNVRLTRNLDMTNHPWSPITEEISYTYEEQYHKDNYMEGMIFDGAGYSIDNLNITGERSVAFIGITSSSFTIQNLTFNKANISASSGWVGAVIGYSSNNVSLINVKVIDSNIGGENAYKVGGLIGMGQLAFGQLTIIDCSVTNTSFKGEYSISGLIGELTGTTNCTFTNNIVANCNFKVKQGELKSSPFAVWDANYMSLDRQNNLNYFNSGTNCSNNTNKDNNFVYGQ